MMVERRDGRSAAGLNGGEAYDAAAAAEVIRATFARHLR